LKPYAELIHHKAKVVALQGEVVEAKVLFLMHFLLFSFLDKFSAQIISTGGNAEVQTLLLTPISTFLTHVIF
jgi:hypothetical protein